MQSRTLGGEKSTTYEPAADKAEVCSGLDGKHNVDQNNCSKVDMTHKLILKIFLQDLHKNVLLSEREPLSQMPVPHPGKPCRNINQNYLEILWDHIHFKTIAWHVQKPGKKKKAIDHVYVFMTCSFEWQRLKMYSLELKTKINKERTVNQNDFRLKRTV